MLCVALKVVMLNHKVSRFRYVHVSGFAKSNLLSGTIIETLIYVYVDETRMLDTRSEHAR